MLGRFLVDGQNAVRRVVVDFYVRSYAAGALAQANQMTFLYNVHKLIKIPFDGRFVRSDENA
jgi:hypothetical protein